LVCTQVIAGITNMIANAEKTAGIAKISRF